MIKSDKYEDFEKHLLNGDICIFETDTVVGIGCIQSSKKFPKIYEIKNRPLDKKIPVLVNKLDYIKQYTNHDLEKGAVTYIVNTGNSTTAYRVPNIKIPDCMIACTSANISGEPAVSNIEDVSNEILNKVDFIYTKKINSKGKSSKIIDLTGPEPKFIR